MKLQKFPRQLWLAFYVLAVKDLHVAWTKPVNSLEIATEKKYYAEFEMSVSPPQLYTQDWKVSDYATNTLTQLNSLALSLAITIIIVRVRVQNSLYAPTCFSHYRHNTT